MTLKGVPTPSVEERLDKLEALEELQGQQEELQGQLNAKIRKSLETTTSSVRNLNEVDELLGKRITIAVGRIKRLERSSTFFYSMTAIYTLTIVLWGIREALK